MRKIKPCLGNIKARTWTSKLWRDRTCSQLVAGTVRGVFSHWYHKPSCLCQSLIAVTLCISFTFPGIHFCYSSAILHVQDTMPQQSRLQGSHSSSYWVRQTHWEHHCSQATSTKANRDAAQEPFLPAQQAVTPTGPRLSQPLFGQGITDAMGPHQASTHNRLMAGRTFGNMATEELLPSNAGHASSSPTPVKALQSALCNAWLAWYSYIRNGFQAAHGIISDNKMDATPGSLPFIKPT